MTKLLNFDNNKQPDNNPELGRLGDFLGFRLRRIQNELSKEFENATQEFNLRSGLFSSLSIIASNPGISQKLLSHAVGLDKSFTVQIIDELERRGFAHRVRSEKDRRRYELACTKEGQAFLDKLFAITEMTEKNVLKHVSDTELALLKALLDRVYETLGHPFNNSIIGLRETLGKCECQAGYHPPHSTPHRNQLPSLIINCQHNGHILPTFHFKHNQNQNINNLLMFKQKLVDLQN